MKQKMILDTELVQILFDGTQYNIFVRMSSGGTIEMEPMPGNLQGLVNALQLATEVCAGKFFVKGVFEQGNEPLQIGERLLIGSREK